MAEVIELRESPDGFSRSSSGLYVPWPRFVEQFCHDWRPGQHLSVLGQNGSGKSHLIRHLLEARWAKSWVYLFDTKVDDIWRAGFRTLRDTPNWLERQAQRMRDERRWYRIIPPTYRVPGRRVLWAFMNSAMRRGSTVVVFDETRTICNRAPGYGLMEQAHHLWQRGRSKHVSVVAGAQSPVHLPSAFYEEATAGIFYGRTTDIRRLKRMEEISGDREELVELVKGLRKYEFVYQPPDGPLAIVKAPAEMPGAKAAASGEWARSRRFRALYGGD